MACVVHITPRHVLQLPEYKAWMDSFVSQRGAPYYPPLSWFLFDRSALTLLLTAAEQ
jgi:hypothetical protein